MSKTSNYNIGLKITTTITDIKRQITCSQTSSLNINININININLNININININTDHLLTIMFSHAAEKLCHSIVGAEGF